MQRIREGLYLLEAARPVNAYLIEGGQGLTLVDTGPARGIDGLVDEIVGGGFSLDDLQRIVLTHAHGDTSGGTAALLRRKRVKVYAHPGEIPALEGKASPARAAGLGGRLRSLAFRLLEKRDPLISVVSASPREPIRGLAQWQVVHAPGHTPGSLALFAPAQGVLLCGDALSYRGERLRIADGDASDRAAALETVKKLATMDVDVLGCGRGPVLRPRAWKHVEALIESRSK